MSCIHRWSPLAESFFHVRVGAAWSMEFCPGCYTRQWHVKNPHVNEPLTEEQPLHITVTR